MTVARTTPANTVARILPAVRTVSTTITPDHQRNRSDLVTRIDSRDTRFAFHSSRVRTSCHRHRRYRLSSHLITVLDLADRLDHTLLVSTVRIRERPDQGPRMRVGVSAPLTVRHLRRTAPGQSGWVSTTRRRPRDET